MLDPHRGSSGAVEMRNVMLCLRLKLSWRWSSATSAKVSATSSTQRETIAHLRQHGYATDLAERLLKNLEDLMEMHQKHLARISSSRP